MTVVALDTAEVWVQFLAQRSQLKNPALVIQIQSLTWELANVTGVAITKKKKKYWTNPFIISEQRSRSPSGAHAVAGQRGPVWRNYPRFQSNWTFHRVV